MSAKWTFGGSHWFHSLQVTQRIGTYVTFEEDRSPSPAGTDTNYYELLQTWYENEDTPFYFVSGNEKTAAIRDATRKLALMNGLAQSLRRSKNMLIVITEATRNNRDWIWFEIEYAVDTCGIPIIAAYPNYEWILRPHTKDHLWPDALSKRITAQMARVVHVPFKQQPIKNAIGQFSVENPPNGALSYYPENAYRSWGLIM
jgi:antiphage defense system Thoeris ThsB-like protein